MPDSDGKLTQEETKKFIAWLNEKSKNHACPVCQNNNWAVGDHIVEGRIFRGGNTIIGGGISYPQIFVSCQNCQYIRHFMAVPILELKSEDEKEEGEKESKEASGAGSG